jgi:hypothetical protein
MREYTHINLNRNNRKFLVVKIEKENLILDENFYLILQVNIRQQFKKQANK